MKNGNWHCLISTITVNIDQRETPVPHFHQIDKA